MRQTVESDVYGTLKTVEFRGIDHMAFQMNTSFLHLEGSVSLAPVSIELYLLSSLDYTSIYCL